jgi:hypothetical protein
MNNRDFESSPATYPETGPSRDSVRMGPFPASEQPPSMLSKDPTGMLKEPNGSCTTITPAPDRKVQQRKPTRKKSRRVPKCMERLPRFGDTPEEKRILQRLDYSRNWGEYLETFTWHYFATLTFPNHGTASTDVSCNPESSVPEEGPVDVPPSIDQARAAFDHWIRRLERASRDRVYFFMAIEKSAQIHIHALVAFKRRKLPRLYVERAWRHRMKKVVPYSIGAGACKYVTKDMGRHEQDDRMYDYELPPA